ncbi:hypothetical protein LVJ94_10955 [Pendulispora rubella]|uniref:Uncharacterized protein n=1 Tax=Pendulispora rubella TaxID=2741070 RepID=A0ABZ2L9Z5_9BACT
MTRSPLRSLFALSFMIGMPMLVLGCPKKKEAVVEVDAAPPPPPPAASSAPAELVPLDVPDAGEDAGTDAATAKKPGSGLTTSQSRVKQCCNAMRAQAKAMGNSPESAQLQAIAAQCDVFAMQVGPSKGAQAPELEPLRQILKGKPTLPPLCSGL